MTSTATTFPLARYRDADGAPLEGWSLATRRRRAAAWALDLALITTTVGVGWLVWTVSLWQAGTTPGKRALGLTVFATDTLRPAERRRMALRSLVHRMWARAMGVSTLGLGFLYVWGGAIGKSRRTLYDDWAQTVVLAAPRPNRRTASIGDA